MPWMRGFRKGKSERVGDPNSPDSASPDSALDSCFKRSDEGSEGGFASSCPGFHALMPFDTCVQSLPAFSDSRLKGQFLLFGPAPRESMTRPD
jgi:hypothetical protein